MRLYFRLVNMLENTEIDHENVWKIIKKTRLKFLFQHSDQDHHCVETLLPAETIIDIMNSLTKELKLSTTDSPIKTEDIPVKKIEHAAEIFTYLFYCPPKIPKHLLFYANLFHTGSPIDIILALTSIIKTSQNSAEKLDTLNILKKVMTKFNFNHYEKIQIATTAL